MLRRAKIRERRRRAVRTRRMVFSVIVAIILILLAYGCYSHYRIMGLKENISTLEQQLKDSETNQKDLQNKLDEMEREWKEKEAELRKKAEAVTDHSDKPNVYLTFDDGPSENTDSILDTLGEHHVRATFFCLAREGEENKTRYQRIVKEGHTLAMHSYSHDYRAIYADLNAFKKDVSKISDFLYHAAGIRPEYYRFPGGSSNTVSKVSMKKCIQYIKKKKITYFDWNAQNDDATGETYTASQLVSHAMAGVRRAGDNVVLLMHDEKTKKATAESIPKLIQELKDAGYDILPITGKTPPIQHVSYDFTD